jgi:aromatic ring-cleaving dioxygenase
MTSPTPHPIAEIASYHAHIYFDGPAERADALALREQIAERFRVSLGSIHDRPVGPHARPMYQISFDIPTLPRLLPWLMLNRKGLAILIHPNTGRERSDHLHHAVWLGEMLPIVNTEMLDESSSAEAARAVNTEPTLSP